MPKRNFATLIVLMIAIISMGVGAIAKKKADDLKSKIVNTVIPATSENHHLAELAFSYLQKSPHAVKVMREVAYAKRNIRIVINHHCDDSTKPQISDNLVLVNWDPKCAHRVQSSGTSPAVALIHEMVHAVHYSQDPLLVVINKNDFKRDYGDNEERITITDGESPIARELGEPLRHDYHAATPYRVQSPIMQ